MIRVLLICLILSGCQVRYENTDQPQHIETNYQTSKCNNKMLMKQDGNGFWYYPKDTTNNKAWIECM
jgi:hypothetical protein